MTTIGARVRSLREYKKWSQEDLAGQSGLKRPHISLIENNERIPGAASLVKLADALQTSVDFLLDRSDNPSPTPTANHPALHDPAFAELANSWPRIPPTVQESLLEFVQVYLDLLDAKQRGEPPK